MRRARNNGLLAFARIAVYGALAGLALIAPQPVLAVSVTIAAEPDPTELVRQAYREHAPGSKELARALEPALDRLINARRLDEARQLALRILSIERVVYGPEHLEVAGTYSNLGLIEYLAGNYLESLPFYQGSLAIRKTQLGPDHADVATDLNNLALLYKTTGQYAQALPLYQRSLEIYEKRLGPVDVNVATLLDNIAELYRTTGQYTVALPLYQRSLIIRETQRGPDHADVAFSLNNLALLYQATGRYDWALDFFQRSIAILAKHVGPESQEVATAKGNLALLYQALGQYALALPLLESSLAIREEQLDPEHADIAAGLNNLAGHFVATGRYGEALPLYRRSLDINQRKLGPEHPDVASVLGNLAWLYRTTGQHAQALAAYQRSLDINQRRLGPEHPYVATGLNNLADLYREIGQYADALPLHLRSLAILEKVLGPEHPDLATSLNNLALLYQTTGQNNQALRAYKRSLAIREMVFGPEHPDVAVSLNNLAWTYRTMGQFNLAVPLFQRSIAIAGVSSLGRATMWQTMANLADLYEEQMEPELAVFWGKQAVNVLQKLRFNVDASDPRLAVGFRNVSDVVYRRLFDLLAAQGRFSEAEQVLQMQQEREFLEDVTRATRAAPPARQVALTGVEPDKHAEFYRLLDRQLTLAQEYGQLLRVSAAERTPQHRARMAELEDYLRAVRAALQDFWGTLAQDLRSMRRAPSVAVVDAERANTQMRRLLESLERDRRGASGRTVGVQMVVAEKRTLLVFTRPFAPPLVQQVDIDVEQLRNLVLRFRASLKRDLIDGPAGSRKLGEELHALLWAPIARHVREAGADRVLLWPTDVLRSIPFAALYDGGSQRYLVQDLTISTFNDLDIRLDRSSRAGANVAGFGLSDGVEKLPALPHVREELDGIKRSWRGTRLWMNAERTAPFNRDSLREALREAEAGRVKMLHVASHFVLEPGDMRASRLYLGDRSTISLDDIDALGWTFHGLDLVVLSACQTADGFDLDVIKGRREIQSLSTLVLKNGASAVMATLWAVNDASTSALMSRFYERLAAGDGKADALRAAQLAMLQRASAEPPKDGKTDWSHPYHWAAVILTGDWR